MQHQEGEELEEEVVVEEEQEAEVDIYTNYCTLYQYTFYNG